MCLVACEYEKCSIFPTMCLLFFASSLLKNKSKVARPSRASELLSSTSNKGSDTYIPLMY
jgi:hypothetical protein